MKTTVIYHSADFDGLFCREIARKFLPEATLIGWDYGDPTPEIPTDVDDLYMLDISIEALMGHPRLTWIDHHKSAIEKYLTDIHGYRIDGVAACRLAWQWFQHGKDGLSGNNDDLPRKEAFTDRSVHEPIAVRLAGEYDIWDKRDPRAELFQHGLRAQELTAAMWETMLGNVTENSITVDALLERGKVLQYARAQECKGVIQSQGFDLKFEGLTFLACNSHELDIRSQLFVEGIRDHHDALLGFTFSGHDWRVSMYHITNNEHHDLSEIAKKYGGGGHRGACGFRCKTLPFALTP